MKYRELAPLYQALAELADVPLPVAAVYRYYLSQNQENEGRS